MGQVKSNNPNLLAKEYTFAFANRHEVMKMQGWTETTQQDQTIFALAKSMADTMNTPQQPAIINMHVHPFWTIIIDVR
jgi:hypothetical protein